MLSSIKNEAFQGESFKLRIKVSNDLTGFLNYARKYKIAYQFRNNISADGSIIKDEIVSSQLRINHVDNEPSLYFFHFKLNNVTVKFDNNMDNFLLAYSDEKCVNKTDDCVTCLWNSDGKRNYLKWCSSYKPCLRSQEMYRKQPDATSKSIVELDDLADTVYVKCPELRVEYVEPLYGPVSARTRMKIFVNNHRISANNRTVTVTVAGRECSDPKTVDDRTITCTVSGAGASVADANRTGPVQVRYGPRVVLEYGRNFSFVDRRVSDVRRHCVRSNGTQTLDVVGDWLDVGTGVRVTLDLNRMEMRTECAITVRDRNRIACRIDPDTVLSTGGGGFVRLEYDDGLWYEYPFPPYSPVLDPSNRMTGIVSGGTVIPVRGTGFSCVGNLSTIRAYLNGTTTYGVAECARVNDTYLECQSPRFNDPRGEPAVLQYDLSDGSVYYASLVPGYRLYPDPVFSDFVIADNDNVSTTTTTTIVLNGRDQTNDTGYGTEDLRVRLPNSTDECMVTNFTPRAIRCRFHRPVSDPQHVIVTVGRSCTYDVKRKSNVLPAHPVTDLSAGKFIATLAMLLLFSVITGATVVLLLLWRTKKSWQPPPEYSEQRVNNAKFNNTIEMDQRKS